MKIAFCATRAACAAALLLLGSAALANPAADAPLRVDLRSRVKSPANPSQFEIRSTNAAWNPKKTALIICDMWDDHWCKGAAARVGELAPRLDQVVRQARARGLLIIHAPSSVTGFYKGTPQRLRAQNAPFVPTPVPLSASDRWGTKWCWPDPAREPALPIDDSDMGCDCATKCLIREAWTRQTSAIHIAPEDAITDHGQETWNLLQQHGIENILIAGVHLNMCVLGRPFAIRQQVHLGQNIALLRDLTDTMYNHQMAPQVSHFDGTDLVLEHIEKFWCPTLTSTALTGEPPFRFKEDPRPHSAAR